MESNQLQQNITKAKYSDTHPDKGYGFKKQFHISGIISSLQKDAMCTRTHQRDLRIILASFKIFEKIIL